MKKKIFEKEKLEELFLKQSSTFLDHLGLMKKIMEDVRDNTFKEIKQEDLPPKCVKITLTKFLILDKQIDNYNFELWAEYSVPKENGVVIGTNIYLISSNGDVYLRNIFGTFFKPKILKQHQNS